MTPEKAEKPLEDFETVTHTIPMVSLDNAFDDGRFGAGDLFAEATLSWHVKQADFAIGYGAWAPTGNSSTSQGSTYAGAGFWTHMFTAGMTWYMDPEKKVALSALNRYEINTEKANTDVTPGQAYTRRAVDMRGDVAAGPGQQRLVVGLGS